MVNGVNGSGDVNNQCNSTGTRKLDKQSYNIVDILIKRAQCEGPSNDTLEIGGKQKEPETMTLRGKIMGTLFGSEVGKATNAAYANEPKYKAEKEVDSENLDIKDEFKEAMKDLNLKVKVADSTSYEDLGNNNWENVTTVTDYPYISKGDLKDGVKEINSEIADRNKYAPAAGVSTFPNVDSQTLERDLIMSKFLSPEKEGGIDGLKQLQSMGYRVSKEDLIQLPDGKIAVYGELTK